MSDEAPFQRFAGFSEGKVRLTPLPEQFFRELLPLVDDLAELKLVLHAFWKLDQMEGSFRYLRWPDFAGDRAFLDSLAGGVGSSEVVLEEALDRAVSRGALLKAVVSLESGEEALYFLNSPRGRAAVQAIERGEWRFSGRPSTPVEVVPPAVNIFNLYEENIGPLTPMVADLLQEAEKTYPGPWIEEAVRIAVENNKRNWRYVEAILRRWQEEGRDERKDRRDTEKARRRYLEWESPELRKRR